MTAVAAPPSGGAGGTITVTSAVGNRGPVGTLAQPFLVSFYLARDQASPDDATPGAGTRIGLRQMGGLAGGTNASITTILTIPANTSAGTYFLSAVADVEQAVTETNRTNNGLTASARIEIGAPDLVMTPVSAPATGGAGGTITLLTTVSNRGPAGTLAGFFRIGVYLSSDDGTPGAGARIGSRLVTGLAGGTNSSALTTVTIPSNTSAGTYFLSVVADADETVPESDETNNGVTAPTRITISVPDLVLTAITAPTTGGAGGTITVTSTIGNSGPVGTSAGPFRLGVYLSPDDATPGAGTLIGSRLIASIPGGTNASVTTTVAVPADTAAGPYFLSVVADTEAAVADPDRANNGLTAPAPITIIWPDLVVTGLTAPATGGVGGGVSVTAVVANQGAAETAAGPFLVQFFLTPTGDTPGTVRSLDAYLVNGLAGGNTSNTRTITVHFPFNVAPGTYALSVTADATGLVPEAAEDNNTTTMPITLFPPDLVTTSVSGPATGQAGGTINVSSTVQNVTAGTGAVGIRVGFYLSMDPTPGTGRLAGSRTISLLAGGATSEAVVPVTVPADLAPGTYYLTALADDTHSITESNEDNNGATAPGQITITAP
jgi:subtilase family serine protease